MSDLHIGIDGGQRGGMAALSPLPGLDPISVIPMPMRRVDSIPQMDIRGVVEWVLSIYPKGDCHVWLEKCPKHAMSQAAMRSQAINYGKMIAIFEARFPHMIVHRVKCGRELQGWQRAMFGRHFTGDESKELALQKAGEYWPMYAWPTDRNGNPFDGCVDAALIGEWGRASLSGDLVLQSPLP